MIGAISNALSGLMAASKRAEASASNIANMSTPDYTPVTTVQTTTETGSVQAQNQPKSAGTINTFVPDIDLAEEAVNLKIAEIAYKANIATIKTAQDMTDELLAVFDKKA